MAKSSRRFVSLSELFYTPSGVLIGPPSLPLEKSRSMHWSKVLWIIRLGTVHEVADRMLESAVTNARVASFHGLMGGSAFRPRPFHSAKPRARRERKFCWPHQRRASVCGSTAALCSDSVPSVSLSPLLCSRSPTADRSRSNSIFQPLTLLNFRRKI